MFEPSATTNFNYIIMDEYASFVTFVFALGLVVLNNSALSFNLVIPNCIAFVYYRYFLDCCDLNFCCVLTKNHVGIMKRAPPIW